MKRFVCLIGVLAMLFTLAACKGGDKPEGNDPTSVPETEVPATEAPATEVPATEAPTNDPGGETETGYADYCVELTPNERLTADIDFDGVDDTIWFTAGEPNEWDERDYTLKVVLGSDPEISAVYTCSYASNASVWLADTAVWDSRLDVLMTFAHDGSDWSSVAMRVSDNGSRIDTFNYYGRVMISEEFPFTSNLGFVFSRRADVLGTMMLGAYFTICEDGFCPMSDYSYPENEEALVLKRAMTAKVLDETGRPTDEIVLEQGDAVIPIQTDLINHVIIKLADGRLAWVELEIRDTDYEYRILLNGIDQDEFFDLFYSD